MQIGVAFAQALILTIRRKFLERVALAIAFPLIKLKSKLSSEW